MKRVNLVIDDDLYSKIEEEARRRHVTPSSLMTEVLQDGIHSFDGINYLEVVEGLCKRVSLLPPGAEFAFNTLLPEDVLSLIAKRAGVSIASAKSRLGKAFAKALRDGKAGKVRLKEEGGKVKRNKGAAIYMKL